MLDLTEANLLTRILAAVIALLGLGGLAAIGIMFAMMMVLFSVDGGQSSPEAQRAFSLGAKIVVASLSLAVIAPPLLLLFRLPIPFCLLPAGIGFMTAGAATMSAIMLNLK